MGYLIGLILGWAMALAMLCAPIIIIYALVQIIRIVIAKKKENKEKQERKKFNNSHPEWIWDEQRQLWVHKSEYEKQTQWTPGDSKNENYHFKKEYIPFNQYEIPKKEETPSSKAEPQAQEQNDSPTPEKYHYSKNSVPESKYEIPKGPMPKRPILHHAAQPKKETWSQPEQPKASSKAEEYSWTIPNQPRIIYTYIRPELPEADKEDKLEIANFQNAYQRRNFLTNNEWKHYQELRRYADLKGYIICPKVRLFDLLEPKYRKKRDKIYQYKIQAKHVDFVVCDQEMKVKAIIELDDSSHYEPERIKRDNFVDMILLSVGYTVIHTLHIDSDTLNYI